MRLSALALPCLLAAACAPAVQATHVDHPVSYVEYAPLDPPPRRPPGERRSRLPAMVMAGTAGALLGGFVGRSACDDLHETDAECQGRTVEGALVGAGIGVLFGAVTRP
jgi:hypothetical protein